MSKRITDDQVVIDCVFISVLDSKELVLEKIFAFGIPKDPTKPYLLRLFSVSDDGEIKNVFDMFTPSSAMELLTDPDQLENNLPFENTTVDDFTFALSLIAGIPPEDFYMDLVIEEKKKVQEKLSSFESSPFVEKLSLVPERKTELTSAVSQKNKHYSGRPFNNHIYLVRLFNIVKLSEIFPLVVLSKKESGTFYNLVKVQKGTPVKDVLNEKGDVLTYKTVRGLVFYSQDFVIKLFSSGETVLTILNEGLDQETVIKDFVKTVSSYPGVFSKKPSVSRPVTLDHYDAKIETGFYIDIKAVRKLLQNEVLSTYFLELKRTDADLSVLYENVTFIVSENVYEKDSSIVTCTRGTPKQILNVLETLWLFSQALGSKSNKKVKARTVKSKLKEAGFLFNSKKCQPPRQPEIVDSDAPGETVTFGKWKFGCPNKSHPHPGFLKDNIPCCFKNNQIGNEAFIRNTDPGSLDTFVSVSNVRIDSRILVKKDDAGYLIYPENDKKDRLVPVNDVDIESVIWSNKVPLATVIYPPSKTNCAVPLNTQNGMVIFRNPEDACKKGLYFGFDIDGIPCCGTTPREIKAKAAARSKVKYIGNTTNKLLNNGKIGKLPVEIGNLLGDSFYRMGVLQNKTAFQNALALPLPIVDQAQFERLDNGCVQQKYDSLGAYLDSGNYKDLSHAFAENNQVNILILRIKDDVKLDHLAPANVSKARGTIVLLKKDDSFEPVVKLDQGNVINGPGVQHLLDFARDSLETVNIFPKDYPFKVRRTPSDLGPVVTGQIKNAFNKTDYVKVKTDSGSAIVPIVESGLVPNLPIEDSEIFPLSVTLEVYSDLKISSSLNELLQTDSGQLVPVKGREMSPFDVNFCIKNNPITDYQMWEKFKKDLADRELEIKRELILATDKKKIKKIIRDTSTDAFEKQRLLEKEFGAVKGGDPRVIPRVAHEVMIDPEQNFINGVLYSSKNTNVVPRENQVFLENLQDLLKYSRSLDA